ncbi:MAG TPA: FxDxF family PEP-CTERM protein [Caulobacteraceae bacterium]|nr:FxDxF family PEP-CTERM protein [Caulobacteraceae bacterium]
MSMLSKSIAMIAVPTGLMLSAASAHALTYSPTISGTPISFTGAFSRSFSGAKSLTPFSDTITFTLSRLGDLNGSLSASSVRTNIIKLTSVTFDGAPVTLTNAAGTYFAGFGGSPLTGLQTIVVKGLEKGNVSYSGNFTFQGVPEPASWSMMLLGAGVIGAAMRGGRRREIFAA